MKPRGPLVLGAVATPAVAAVATSAPPEAVAAPEPVQGALTLGEELAVREVLGLPLRLLTQLPAPATVLCRREPGFDAGGQLVLTTSQPAYVAARARGLPVFVGGELEPLAAAAEHDRAFAPQLASWCTRKLEDGQWRLTRSVAIGALSSWPPPSDWTLERVARRLGMVVLWVGVGEQLPADWRVAA